MNCRQLKKLVSAYSDNELAADIRRQITEHCTACTACKQLVAEYRKLIHVLGAARDVEPPPGLRAAVNARLDRDEPVARPAVSDIFRAMSLSWRVVGGLAVVVSVFGLYAVLQPALPPPTSSTAFLPPERVAAAQSEALSPDAAELLAGLFDNMVEVSTVGQEPQPHFMFASSAPLSSATAARPRRVAAERDEALGRQTAASGQSVTIDLGTSDWISANRKQQWQVRAPDINASEAELKTILTDLQVASVSRTMAPGTRSSTYQFVIRYGQIPVLLERARRLGEVELMTPLPTPRPEAYIGIGGINPRVLEEKIQIDLLISE